MTAQPTDETTLRDARSLGSLVRAHEAEIDAARQLPPAVLSAFHDAGVFRLSLSPSLGGSGADPITVARVVEETARANGSAGWCVMIANQLGAVVSAYLPEQGGRDIYGPDPRVVNAGAAASTGRAVPVDGGYLVTGRWGFASGCMHSDWLHGGCFVGEDDHLRMTESGTPEIRIVFVPKSECEVIDTWDVTGLRGTGSHDFTVSNVFVREHRTMPFSFGAPPRDPAPAYQLWALQFIGQATVMLGIAERALDEFRGLAQLKTPRLNAALLRDQPTVQREFGQAWTAVQAARSYLYETASSIYAALESGADVSLEARAALRLAMTHAARTAVAAIDLLHSAAGASAIWNSSGIERCFRDIHTANAHLTVAPLIHQEAAKVLLGLEPGPSFF